MMHTLRFGRRLDLVGMTKYMNRTKTELCMTTLPSKGEKQFKIATFFSDCSVHSLAMKMSPSRYLLSTNKQIPCFISKSKELFGTTRVKCNSQSLSGGELKKAVDTLTDQFMEARELLQDARESLGTVYFSEDMKEAQTAVTGTLIYYKNLLSQLSPEQKQDVLRTIGLKMEELKAQEQFLEDEASR